MPFESSAQNRWGHTPAGIKALGGKAKVKEWEQATDYSHLPEKVMNKGHLSKTESFAQGGAVLGRTRDFMKEPDGKDQNAPPHKVYKDPDVSEQQYGKGKSTANPKGRDKSEKAIVPKR